MKKKHHDPDYIAVSLIKASERHDNALKSASAVSAWLAIAIAVALLTMLCCGCAAAPPRSPVRTTQQQRVYQLEQRMLGVEKKLIEQESWIRWLSRKKHSPGSGDAPYPQHLFPSHHRSKKEAAIDRSTDIQIVSATRVLNDPFLAPAPPTEPQLPKLSPVPDHGLPKSIHQRLPQDGHWKCIGFRRVYSWDCGWHPGIYAARFGWGWTPHAQPIYVWQSNCKRPAPPCH